MADDLVRDDESLDRRHCTYTPRLFHSVAVANGTVAMILKMGCCEGVEEPKLGARAIRELMLMMM